MAAAKNLDDTVILAKKYLVCSISDPLSLCRIPCSRSMVYPKAV